jgi:DNA mismatch repair protein MutS2
MISQHTLEVLEYPKIISLILGKCLTPIGRVYVEQFAPMSDAAAINRRQDEIQQIKDIVNFGYPFPLERLLDSTPFIEQAKLEGVFIEPQEILAVLRLVDISLALHGYDKENRAKFPLVDEYLKRVRAFPELKKQIIDALEPTGEIKDSASPALRRIRNELHETRRKTISRLEGIIGGQKKQSGWQDDIVTQRNDRYVIPVISANYRTDMGILHDRSQSGATLYIEPAEVVEMNNRLHLLLQEERLEIDRILRAITREIGQRAGALLENWQIVGQLDSFHAAALLANDTKANRPYIESTATGSLIDARHPLLILKLKDPKNVVPLTLNLNDDRPAVLVTGPNTGGKTIALKTFGLLTLMAMTGLPIPARETSRVGVFTRVFADIGDEQSIELSLSTFSSHITNIITAVKKADSMSLVLLDEIGAGTDPKEGAALAESIVLHLLKTGARMIVTTHYSQLKTLALDNPEIENASLSFDRQTLSPTYHLQLGIPGSSYAVEIASRLGMPGDICTRASDLIGSGERSLTALISSLERELSTVRNDKINLTERLAAATEAENKYQTLAEKLRVEVEAEKKKALAETETLLDMTRKETERLVGEIRKSAASADSIKQMHQTLKSIGNEVGKQKDTLKKKAPRQSLDRFAEGDRVYLTDLAQDGEIVELVGSDRARVRVGNITTVIDLRKLQKQGSAEPRQSKSTVSRVNAESMTTPEIHLRGMTSEEAIEALDRFLDHALVSGLTQVYVIHGKGTGTLRRTISGYLKKHRDVAGIRMGDWNEGGAGVTIVTLKS